MGTERGGFGGGGSEKGSGGSVLEGMSKSVHEIEDEIDGCTDADNVENGRVSGNVVSRW